MKHPAPPLPAKLIKRPNRFLGIVDLDGKHVEAFIPNPGRMHELMVPGTRVYVIPREGNHRKTKFDLTLMEYNNTLVSIDSRLPNHMLREAINAGLPEFKGYHVERAEPTFHDSRLDLKLTDGTNQILLEAKSCTLVEDGIALFPDAPTKRGARHMNTLVVALNHGRAVVCFVIQRNDAREWRPNEKMDPDFTDALRNAVKKGVEAYAFTCDIKLDTVSIKNSVPINLD
ncbi:DNA/RNA nuclease SfsA [Candidatus Bathyarchaeota archaeon]|nr:DNA/RNA nuclease SfsA [Candidatus Bathyarchaeota archaeon]MBT4319085.1 DNA/RNA nuclease SfsA [Candidatus Bathyarchaeota archaeon]MBT4424339.1 DNA/RNA nuclease SfsA [Candidatus Bathyarchaeota archaeon]MBT5641649.1 DNA/RNA nuclease SfsA [Candidatus Bathyarchaeota archaeon]MBT6604669.1 DNA/RNA nuclease SfsA [Candidatus Bathyarchaeota archaeon]